MNKKNIIRLLIIKSIIKLIIVCMFTGFSSCEMRSGDDISELESGFATPPDSVHLGVYWYWISNHISKEGVIRDLEAMKEVGIGRAFIGNILNNGTPVGPVEFYSDEWWEITHAAFKRATELGIDIGQFNSPGWSQSGGPWINPNESMRYLKSVEYSVSGPDSLSIKLIPPTPDFETVRVLAYPRPTDEESITIYDEDISDLIINLNSQQSIPARALVITPSDNRVRFEGELLAKIEGQFKPIKRFTFNRTNFSPNVGFDPKAPVVITFDKTISDHFQILITNVSAKGKLAKVTLTSAALTERYPEKQLAKMFQSPLPMWGDYLWEDQVAVDDSSLVIAPSSVIDITANLDKEGELRWIIPNGDWVIVHSGMTTTGVTNSPAVPEATGLEVDKMSSKHIEKHFNAYIGEMLRRIPAEDRKSFKVVVQDSYETGSQNWTDNFIALFNERYGYDPTPFIPSFAGRVVGSRDMTDRFFWDLRRLVADKIAYDYVGGLRKVSHKHGLTTWLENYGHWGFPGEFLQYGGQSDEVAGEFWNEGTLGNIENRAASSSAHIYGKRKVWSESFTASGKDFQRYPAMLKRRGDWSFTEGINSTLLHLFIQQPYEERTPGMNAWFSTEFNRKNSWFAYSKPFFDYIRRCNFILQHGQPVNDVAYYIGDDAPKMTGEPNPSIPKGYSFDYINSEVILQSLCVRDGEWVLPHGVRYKLLVLPPQNSIRPEVYKRLLDLVIEGGVLYGSPMHTSPSLENYPNADKIVIDISKQIWNDLEPTKGRKIVGKGKVYTELSLEELFEDMKLPPDCFAGENAPLLYAHRKFNEGDIYFLTNQSDSLAEMNVEFRVKNLKPECWNPIDGSIRPFKAYYVKEGVTSLPIRLYPNESVFVVFRNGLFIEGSKHLNDNYPVAQQKIDLSGNEWKIRFVDTIRGPKQPLQTDHLFDWTTSDEPLIKYYSGVAEYTTSFIYDEEIDPNEVIILNLGKVTAMAKVILNGKEVGTAWTAPWEVTLSKAIKKGSNELKIEVVNTWVNRLTGDALLPEEKRTTWVMNNTFTPQSSLQESGLVGPVSIRKTVY